MCIREKTGGEVRKMYKLDGLYWKLRSAAVRKLAEEDGINTIEIVVILGILVTLAILFGGQLTELFNTWWSQIATSR